MEREKGNQKMLLKLKHTVSKCKGFLKLCKCCLQRSELCLQRLFSDSSYYFSRDHTYALSYLLLAIYKSSSEKIALHALFLFSPVLISTR